MIAHEYEEGDQKHPMHTDPLCAVCGQPRIALIHDTTRRTDGHQ